MSTTATFQPAEREVMICWMYE